MPGRTSKSQELIRAAGNRCGYCHVLQELVPVRFEIEHLRPRRRGGSDSITNLYLACPTCNRYKGSQLSAPDPRTGRKVRLFNPRWHIWHRHFRWIEDGLRVEGLSPTGRATVFALQLNAPLRLPARHFWIRLGVHPPAEDS